MKFQMKSYASLFVTTYLLSSTVNSKNRLKDLGKQIEKEWKRIEKDELPKVGKFLEGMIQDRLDHPEKLIADLLLSPEQKVVLETVVDVIDKEKKRQEARHLSAEHDETSIEAVEELMLPEEVEEITGLVDMAIALETHDSDELATLLQ